MTRGNQREIDRQRAQNRHAHKDVTVKEGTVQSRREADAAALAEKIARKRAAEEAAKSGVPIPEAPKGLGGTVKKKDGSK